MFFSVQHTLLTLMHELVPRHTQCPITNSLLSGLWISPELWYGGACLWSPALLDVLSARSPFNTLLFSDRLLILCMCFFFALCLSGLYYIIICKCTTAFQMCTEAEDVFMYCLLCFSVSPLLLLSLSLSSLSLISGLKSLDILLHPQKHTLTEWKSCYKQPKPTFCSPLCCYFALQSVSLSLSPTFFPSHNFLFLYHFITSPNHCPHVFSYYLHLLPAPISTHFYLRGRLALDVDLRRTDIQRPVPCLQHWHFCQTLMVPLNRDVWREELPVSLPSSSSNSASPPLRVRCTVAACSPITCTDTWTERANTLRLNLRRISAHMTLCVCMLKGACSQSRTSCWNAFKASLHPLIKLAPGERQRVLEVARLSFPPLPSPLLPTILLLRCLQRHPCHFSNPEAPLLLFFLNFFQSFITSPPCMLCYKNRRGKLKKKKKPQRQENAWWEYVSILTVNMMWCKVLFCSVFHWSSVLCQTACFGRPPTPPLFLLSLWGKGFFFFMFWR